MDSSDREKFDYASPNIEEDTADLDDGRPLKPTRADPRTILMVMLVCGFFCFLFLMFILRVF